MDENIIFLSISDISKLEFNELNSPIRWRAEGSSWWFLVKIFNIFQKKNVFSIFILIKIIKKKSKFIQIF